MLSIFMKHTIILSRYGTLKVTNTCFNSLGFSQLLHNALLYYTSTNALRRDCNGKCIELIEGHYLEVVVL